MVTKQYNKIDATKVNSINKIEWIRDNNRTKFIEQFNAIRQGIRYNNRVNKG